MRACTSDWGGTGGSSSVLVLPADVMEYLVIFFSMIRQLIFRNRNRGGAAHPCTSGWGGANFGDWALRLRWTCSPVVK